MDVRRRSIVARQSTCTTHRIHGQQVPMKLATVDLGSSHKGNFASVNFTRGRVCSNDYICEETTAADPQGTFEALHKRR